MKKPFQIIYAFICRNADGDIQFLLLGFIINLPVKSILNKKGLSLFLKAKRTKNGSTNSTKNTATGRSKS